MRFINIEHIHGLAVEYKGEPILITVNAQDPDNIIFNMRHAVTDKHVTRKAVSEILLGLMLRRDDE